MSYNIQNSIAQALQQILSNPRNHQDLFLFHAYQAAIYNHWQNDTFSKMINTAVLTWDMLSQENSWPTGVISVADKEDYVCDLIIRMSGAALIARDPNQMRMLGPQDQYAVSEALRNAQTLTSDLDAFQKAAMIQNRGTNARYGNVKESSYVNKPQSASSGGHSRYGRTAEAAVIPTTRNVQTEEPIQSIPFVLKRGSEMDYANHKLSYELNPNSRRKKPNKDFMGELAKADIIPVTAESAPNLDITKAIAPSNIPIATSIEHAKTLAMIDIANHGGVVNEDHLLEYSYQQLNTLKVFTDTAALQIFSVSEPSIGALRLCETVEEAAECIKSLLESTNPFAVSIGRRLNARATKATNDELAFRLVVEEIIEDFAEDVALVPGLLLEIAGDEQDFLDAWGPAEMRILESVRCIYLGPSEPEDIEQVNTIMAGDVAERSIFWMDPTYVSFLPVAFYHLGIDTNFSAIGQAFLRKNDHPEIYDAFRGIISRAYEARGASYQRIIVVTDDNVRLELFETDVVGDKDVAAHILIRAA